MTDGIRHAAARRAGGQRAAWRAAVNTCLAGAVVVTVVPLSLAQVPFGGFPLLAGSGSATAESGLVLVTRADSNPGIRRTAGRGPGRPTGELAAFPAVRRAQTAVLAPPVIALAVLAVEAGDRPGHALAAVALCEAAVLLALAAMTARGQAGDGFATACAMAGFVVAPASAELLGLRATIAAGTGGRDVLLVAGVIVGVALGAITALAAGGARGAAQGPVGGLLLVAGALVVACFAGPFANTAVLALLVAAVAAGLTAALARPAGETTTAGALVGSVLLVSGMLVGSLAAAAIRVQLAAPSPAAQHGASVVPSGLPTAYGWWLLAGAAVAVAVALSRSARRARRPRRREGPPRQWVSCS